MKELTDTKNCLLSSDDPESYLSWPDMEWNKFGFIEEYEVSVQTMCKDSDGITSLFLPTEYNFMTECMQTCEKLNKAFGPHIDTVEEKTQWDIRQMKYAENPGGSPSVWIPWTDEQVEEEWRDFFTGMKQGEKYLNNKLLSRRGQGQQHNVWGL